MIPDKLIRQTQNMIFEFFPSQKTVCSYSSSLTGAFKIFTQHILIISFPIICADKLPQPRYILEFRNYLLIP